MCCPAVPPEQPPVCMCFQFFNGNCHLLHLPDEEMPWSLITERGQKVGSPSPPFRSKHISMSFVRQETCESRLRSGSADCMGPEVPFPLPLEIRAEGWPALSGVAGLALEAFKGGLRDFFGFGFAALTTGARLFVFQAPLKLKNSMPFFWDILDWNWRSLVQPCRMTHLSARSVKKETCGQCGWSLFAPKDQFPHDGLSFNSVRAMHPLWNVQLWKPLQWQLLPQLLWSGSPLKNVISYFRCFQSRLGQTRANGPCMASPPGWPWAHR